MAMSKNIFNAILLVGHDEDFFEVAALQPTDHPPGSVGKVEAMRERVERGQSPFHPDDSHIHATHDQVDEACKFIQEQMKIRYAKRKSCK